MKSNTQPVYDPFDCLEHESRSYVEQIYQFAKNPDLLREMYYDLKYLNEHVLQLLLDSKLAKEFFNQISKPKTRLILDLLANKTSEKEIIKIVSVAVQLFVSEYETTGKVRNRKNLSKSFLEDGEEKPGKKLPKIKANIFKYVPSPLFKITTGGADGIQQKDKNRVKKAKSNR